MKGGRLECLGPYLSFSLSCSCRWSLWPPAMHICAVSVPFIPEQPCQGRLFIEDDTQMKAHGEHRRIHGHAPRACDQAPAENKSDDTHVYRVAHKAIKPNC